jgi:hypothetical protein
MLRIQNKNKLVGNDIIVGGDIWEIIGVYEYPSQYQIHLRTGDSSLADKLFILKEEDGFYGLQNAKYKITDRDDSSNSVWVGRASIANISSMVRTLRRIISHAND